MKKIIIASVLLVSFISCKKSSNTAPSIVSQASKCGLQFEHIYQVSKNRWLPGEDFIIFHSNQTISEWIPAFSGNPTDTFKYSASFIFSNNFASGLLQNSNAFKVHINSTLDTSNRCVFYVFSNISYDTITLGTFISGDIVQNNLPTLGATNLTSSDFLIIQ